MAVINVTAILVMNLVGTVEAQNVPFVLQASILLVEQRHAQIVQLAPGLLRAPLPAPSAPLALSLAHQQPLLPARV